MEIYFRGSICSRTLENWYYTYYKRGQQKRLEQTKRRGRRLSIVGIFQKELSFVYGLVIGGVD